MKTLLQTVACFFLLAGWTAALPGLRGQEPVLVVPKVQFILTEAAGKPGDLVGIVLSLVTSEPLKSITVAINFEETKLRLERFERVVDPANASPLDDVSKSDVDNRDESPGDQAREGWIFFELIALNITGDLKWPIGTEIPLYNLQFRVLRGAREGLSPVVFARVGADEIGAASMENTAAAREADSSPVAVAIPPEDLDDGGVIILGLGEVGFFLRADTNMDRSFDISDPVSTLNYLFSGGTLLVCEDAADANDDGKINLGDAVFTLYWLFWSGKPPPDPQAWGPDPTEDFLCCAQTGGCP